MAGYVGVYEWVEEGWNIGVLQIQDSGTCVVWEC